MATSCWHALTYWLVSSTALNRLHAYEPELIGLVDLKKATRALQQAKVASKPVLSSASAPSKPVGRSQHASNTEPLPIPFPLLLIPGNVTSAIMFLPPDKPKPALILRRLR